VSIPGILPTMFLNNRPFFKKVENSTYTYINIIFLCQAILVRLTDEFGLPELNRLTAFLAGRCQTRAVINRGQVSQAANWYFK
jgi:hypothetical protein